MIGSMCGFGGTRRKGLPQVYPAAFLHYSLRPTGKRGVFQGSWGLLSMSERKFLSETWFFTFLET